MAWPVNSGTGPSEKLKDSKPTSARIQAMPCLSTARFKGTGELSLLLLCQPHVGISDWSCQGSSLNIFIPEIEQSL